MIRKEEVFKIGKIGKPHGVKGEVGLRFSDDVFDRVDAEYLILDIDGILVPFFMEEYRFRSDENALVKFCDIDSLERAAEITGCDVFFPRSLADEDDGEMTWSQIVGYTLINTTVRKTWVRQWERLLMPTTPRKTCSLPSTTDNSSPQPTISS